MQPNVPRWGGAWDAANMMTPNVVSPATTPYYGAPLNSGMGFTLPLWQNIRAYQAPAAAFSNVPGAAASTVPGYQPTAAEVNAARSGMREDYPQYAPGQVLGGGGGELWYTNSVVPIWMQSEEEQQATNEFWAGMANQDQSGWTPEQQAAYIATYYGENGTPRPGDPYQVYPYWKHQRFSSASYGPDGQKRKAAPQDPYSFKSRQGVNNTNKYRTPPPDGMATQQQPGLGSIPAWAGDLVSWRT